MHVPVTVSAGSPETAGALLGVAAGLATRQVPTAPPSETAGAARAALADSAYDSAVDVAVLDGGRLAGLVPIERLLAAPADSPLADLMDPEPPVVGPETDQERAAWTMIERGESSLAVADEHGRFLGLIAPQRMLAVLLAAHDEDLARLGGYLAGTSRARQAAEEPVLRRLWHRLPWLLVGLAGAMAAALIVGAFEDELKAKLVLAFFVPGVVYMADAVGTQTEALLIRGLSVGIAMRTVVRRELVTGLVLGVLVGAAFLAFAWLLWGDSRAAASVAIALFASCSIATFVAMALPWTFQRLGHDPAFGSGPLATVIQDLLSIAIYFAVAAWIAL
ncbi:MAG TPA: magnesium transporter [Solirubrobacteraceae bacterium]|jgi:magnesium transporter|nr:magnesium transporter [Solirubrobacteraceae bacterium]